MLSFYLLIAGLLAQFVTVIAAPYDARWAEYNLNQNPDPNATVLEFYGNWTGHSYHASPSNGWRSLPVYSFILDRFKDGNPSNNDFFHTMHEWDQLSTQQRFGGDVAGLASDRSLDYLQGMGIKALYIIGAIFLNMPWEADQYSCLDQTILDPHLGDIEDWRNLVDKLHARGMYLVLDMTQATMGDLIGFDG